MRDGTTRAAQTSKGFWIPADVKEHLDELVIARVQSQGMIISDLIFRCLGYAVANGLNKGRQARRRGRHKDSVQIMVMIKNDAVKMLKDYCELSGETMSATVTRLIRVAEIDPVFDIQQVRAALDRPEEQRRWKADRKKSKEQDEQELAKYGKLLRHFKPDSSEYWNEVFRRRIHAELEEELGKPLDYM